MKSFQEIEYLQDLCGLEVICYHSKGTNCYVFRKNNRDIAAFYTYPKAKAFAKGVQYGILLEKFSNFPAPDYKMIKTAKESAIRGDGRSTDDILSELP